MRLIDVPRFAAPAEKRRLSVRDEKGGKGHLSATRGKMTSMPPLRVLIQAVIGRYYSLRAVDYGIEAGEGSVPSGGPLTPQNIPPFASRLRWYFCSSGYDRRSKFYRT